MSAKADAQIGVRATVHAGREEVVAACTRAAEVLGRHATASATSAKVAVRIYPGLIKSASKISPLVGITLSPGTDGAVQVAAKVEKYKTLQSRMFLIPIGPKRLVGKSTYLNFLKALEAELRAIDSGGGTIERTAAGR